MKNSIRLLTSSSREQPHDESSLAARLCEDWLTAIELKTLCQSRGFPLQGGNKQDRAASAAVRFLEPLGVREAMLQLEPLWRKALHLVAAHGAPLELRALHALVEPEAEPWRVDCRALWRQATAGLLARGVLLAFEENSLGRKKDRYDRFSLVLPESFQGFLPHFPIPVMPVDTATAVIKPRPSGTVDDLLEAALETFLERGDTGKKGKEKGTIAQLASHLSIKDGILRMGRVEHPSAAIIGRMAAQTWHESLAHDSGYSIVLAPGGVAYHILANLPPRSACAPTTLRQSLGEFGVKVKPQDLDQFCEEGAVGGFLQRFESGMSGPLYRAPAERPLPGRADLVLEAAPGGVYVKARGSGLLPLLQVATISLASVDRGRLLLEPDPIRIGRSLLDLPAELVTRLSAGSPAFDRAIRLVQQRQGQVLVHRGLSVLRVEDTGLRALLKQRFSASVREIDPEYLACLAASAEEIVAFAKKEGYVTRRMP